MKPGRAGRTAEEAPPESDRRPPAPHPREQTALFGHAAGEKALLDAYRSGRFPHAWIFGGRPGIGKATLAWRLVRFLAAHPDPQAPIVQDARTLFVPPEAPAARQIAALAEPNVALLRREWNFESKPPKHFGVIRVDEVRAATRRFRLSAVGGGWRVAVVDTADDLNPQAANALLKMVEEPPPRSLFLFVSHQPGRLLATIRSRCRKLMLQPLSNDELAGALASIGIAADARSCRRARGSVGRVLELQGEGGGRLAGEVERLLAHLPAVDWREVSALAERVAPARAEADYEAFVALVFDYLDEEVRQCVGQGAHRLAPLAQVWEKFAEAARATELLNLDKRPLVLSLFEDLGAAKRRTASAP